MGNFVGIIFAAICMYTDFDTGLKKNTLNTVLGHKAVP